MTYYEIHAKRIGTTTVYSHEYYSEKDMVDMLNAICNDNEYTVYKITDNKREEIICSEKK